MMVEVDHRVIEEARVFNADLENLFAALTPMHTVPPEETRQARREGRGIFPPPVFLPQARDVTIPARRGEVRLRLLDPDSGASGVYLHIHGGGWALGAADQQDLALWRLVQATGLCVVSVDYRLAPEHPYPAGPDDCEDAALWLIEKGAADLGAPPRLLIGGESAGAHLTVTTLLRLRDRHGMNHEMDAVFRGANLVYGCYDLSMTPSQRRWNRNLVLYPEGMAWFLDGFTPGIGPEARRHPDISPLYADLHGLPPALFTVGTLDPLLDDSLFMEARWRYAGNGARLRVWPEAVHGFSAFPLTLAELAGDEQCAFLREMLKD